MLNQFSRTELLLGEEKVNILKKSRVAVFGIGGVGGFCVEGLVRAGVGAIDLIDSDVVNLTNINRQIVATHNTIGMPKVEVMKDRILSINPNCDVRIFNMFVNLETISQFNFEEYDYVVDAVDTVSAKLLIIENAKLKGINVISSMGTGNKLNPTKFEIADIFKTSVCPLARVIRKELKNRNINSLKVLYSKEEPIKLNKNTSVYKETIENEKSKKEIPASISFVPSVAGLIIAGEIIKDLIGKI